jgi:alpha-L-fucosidase
VALFPYAASVGGAPPPPPTPTGEGGHCPFFSGTGGGVISGTGAAVCASPPAIRAWQGLKFGLFLHWGAYSQIGFDASWSLNWKTVCEFGNPGLCEPKNCSQCTHEDMQKFRTMYWNLSTTFNPTKFDPTKWAAVAKGAGMKYFVMTTKHHDGFAMYNTSAHGAPGQPVYGVTGSDCPTQRDLFGEVAAAMRAEGLLVGAYYSKADWHAHSFWDESLGFPTDRNVNYNITTNPAKWQTFVEFDKAQLSEIQAQYSPDIYWLDAGWVGQGLQHLPLTTWATEHRKVNPRQLWVNRDGGVVEDYLTPENPPPSSLTQTVRRLTAHTALHLLWHGCACVCFQSAQRVGGGRWRWQGLGLRPKPWEVCMTLGQKWAYQRNDTYKTTQTIVQTLVSVVATGGSLLLDVGPMPSGELPPTAVQRLGAAGSWLRVNAEAIYDTMPQVREICPAVVLAHRFRAEFDVYGSCVYTTRNCWLNEHLLRHRLHMP